MDHILCLRALPHGTRNIMKRNTMKLLNHYLNYAVESELSALFSTLNLITAAALASYGPLWLFRALAHVLGYQLLTHAAFVPTTAFDLHQVRFSWFNVCYFSRFYMTATATLFLVLEAFGPGRWLYARSIILIRSQDALYRKRVAARAGGQ